MFWGCFLSEAFITVNDTVNGLGGARVVTAYMPEPGRTADAVRRRGGE